MNMTNIFCLTFCADKKKDFMFELCNKTVGLQRVTVLQLLQFMFTERNSATVNSFVSHYPQVIFT